jgi:hypothetical protein
MCHACGHVDDQPERVLFKVNRSTCNLNVMHVVMWMATLLQEMGRVTRTRLAKLGGAEQVSEPEAIPWFDGSSILETVGACNRIRYERILFILYLFLFFEFIPGY